MAVNFTTIAFLLVFAVYLAPQWVHASKTCRGFCDDAAGTILCKGGCGITKGLCKAQNAACVAGCAFAIVRKARRKCLRRCRRDTVEPCVRKIVDNCKSKCVDKVVKPCERRCTSALPEVCRKIMAKVPRDQLVKASKEKRACLGVSAVVGFTATQAGLATGLAVTGGNPAGGFAGGVLGVVMGRSFGEACKALSGQGLTNSEFENQACRKMGF